MRWEKDDFSSCSPPVDNSTDVFRPLRALIVEQNASVECSTGGEQELKPSFTHLIYIYATGSRCLCADGHYFVGRNSKCYSCYQNRTWEKIFQWGDLLQVQLAKRGYLLLPVLSLGQEAWDNIYIYKKYAHTIACSTQRCKS